ncbi:hypothetical protein [Bradyrhizobium sp. Ai1a-2]|uniref:hypothetical protein n=1 Tax=Bradyrhizobium sp. Ai1a-2 TaxID=196490 RepID=UPI00042930E0|nr:hypothetical protein [Bradyrhizobium sp. Ai1a-2]
MPILKNGKHELFAQWLAKGKSQMDAYALAGFKPHSANANRLSGYESVRARVAELKERAAARSEITTESLIAELDEVLELAKAKGQTAAAVSALKEKAILSGKRIERRENGNAGDFAALTDDELENEIRALTSGGITPVAAASGRASHKGKSSGVRKLN